MNMAIIQDPEFADIYYRMISGEAPQNLIEAVRVRTFITMNARHGDIAYRQYTNGFIDEDSLNSILAPLVIFLQFMKPGKPRWEEMRPILNSDYVQYVDNMLENL